MIALVNSIEIYAWAPKPYHKFMAFKVSMKHKEKLEQKLITYNEFLNSYSQKYSPKSYTVTQYVGESQCIELLDTIQHDVLPTIE